MAKKYTSNYNIKDYVVNSIAPKYFKAQGGGYEEYWKPIQAFIDKYEEAFQLSNTDKYDDKIVDAYVSDLEKLVRKYYRCLTPKKK